MKGNLANFVKFPSFLKNYLSKILFLLTSTLFFQISVANYNFFTNLLPILGTSITCLWQRVTMNTFEITSTLLPQTSCPKTNLDFKRHFPLLYRKHQSLRRWPKRFSIATLSHFTRHSRVKHPLIIKNHR